jgi:hypothetical protein
MLSSAEDEDDDVENRSGKEREVILVYVILLCAYSSGLSKENDERRRVQNFALTIW